jgi:hypothetical protein
VRTRLRRDLDLFASEAHPGGLDGKLFSRGP